MSSPPASRIVTLAEAGQRLDQWLSALPGGHSRSRWQELVKQGLVTLNGATAKASVKLREQDCVAWREPEPRVLTATLPEDIPLSILYEDEDLVAVDKPAGMVVHPAAGHWEGTLVNALLHHCGELSLIGGTQRPGIVHRLDKETSGCLVVAKNDLAHQRLARQFAGRTVRKIYLALARGPFRQQNGVIEAPIGRNPVDRKKMAVRTEGPARAAKTSWRVVRELAFGTLVECTLHTGRTHQIRIHLKHLGHPLLGDALYGQRGSWPRQMLHAWQLAFEHPRWGIEVAVRAPVPADFLAAGVDFLE